MAANTTINLPAGEWVELTGEDVDSITFQNLTPNHVLVQATPGSEPTDAAGSIRYNPGQGERNVSLADLWPGVDSASRVWALAPQGSEVFVSHA